MKNRNGFTLVELLAVIAILAILVIIALPNVIKMYNNARKQAFLTEARTVYKEVEKKYIRDSINGSTTRNVNSKDNKLDLTGNKIDYDINLGGNGKITDFKAYDSSYCIDGKFNDISELDIDDVTEGPCVEIVPESFETDDWSTVVAAVRRGKTEKYNVGDLRTITLGDYGDIKLRIANKSTPNECSTEGFSQTACGFVLEFQYPIMETNMVQTLESGWPSSTMRTFINDKIYNALPDEIKNSIIDTNVVTENDSSIGSGLKSTDKIYLISAIEVYGPTFASLKNVDGEHTRQMDYYAGRWVTVNSGENASKANTWILRSMSSATDGTYYCISMRGNIETCGKTNYSSIFLAPAFRIG